MPHSPRRSAGAAVHARGHWLAERADGGLGTVEIEVAEQQPPEAHHGRVKNPYPLAFHRHSDSSRRSSLFSMELAFVACCIFFIRTYRPRHSTPRSCCNHRRRWLHILCIPASSGITRRIYTTKRLLSYQSRRRTSRRKHPRKTVRLKCNLVAPPPTVSTNAIFTPWP